MAVLNENEFYYLDCPRHDISQAVKEHRPGTAAWNLRNFNDRDYFYYEFKQGSAFAAFPIDELLGPEKLEMVKSGRAMLCVNNAHEAFHSAVHYIYKYLVERAGIPSQNILLMSESADILSEVNKKALEFKTHPIKCEWTLQFEWNCKLWKSEMIEKGFFPPDTLQLKHYDKKYLNFNRRWRVHRVALVALLKAKGLLPYGHVSLGKADTNDNWQSGVFDYVKFLSAEEPELYNLYTENTDAIVSMPDMYLDTTNLVENRAWLTPDTDYLYSDTYVSVISETNYYTKIPTYEAGRFYSEKTFKPIVQKHPFIAATVPNFLPKLRWLGYKTFSPWIDESYDEELDDNKRLLKISKEIERLSKLEGKQLEEYLIACKEICEHNYRHLMSKTQFSHPLN